MIIFNSPSATALGADKNDNLEKVPFVFISKIGGMVGGFSAISNSQYIGSTGLIQVSREETNGVLHLLKQGHANTRAIFEYLNENSDILQYKSKTEIPKQDYDLTEYYPPKTLLCYFSHEHNNICCHYFNENEITDAVRDFLNEAQKLVDQQELSLAEAGMYVRAQFIPDAKRSFVKPDIKFKNIYVATKQIHTILENQMSLIRVGDMSATYELSEKLSFLPNKPLYIQIGKDVYLFITYRYEN